MSSADSRAAFLKLRITLAKEDVKSAVRSLDSLHHGYLDLEDAEIAAAQAARQYLKSTSQVVQGNKQVAASARQATTEIKKASKAQGTFLTGDIQDQLRRARTENRAESFAIRGALGAIPGGGGAIGQGAADIFNLIDAIPELNLSFKVLKASILENISALGVSGVGLIAGLAALAAAIAFFNSQNEKAAQSVRALIGSQQEYYKVVTSGSYDQIRAARDAQALEAEIARARIAENKRLLDGLREQAGPVAATLADVFNLAGAKELREETQKLEAELKTAEFLQGRYTAALRDTNIVQDGLVAKAIAVQKAFDARYEVEIQANLALNKLTGESARERIDAIGQEISLLRAYADRANTTAEFSEKLNERIRLLGFEMNVLNEGLSYLVNRDAAQKAAQSLADALSSIPAMLKKVAERIEAIAKVNGEIAELKKDHSDKILQIEKDLQAKQIEAARDRDAAIAEAERDAILDRSEAIRDAQLDREEAELDHQKNLAKIQRQFNLSREQAIQDRDAVALDNAERTRKESLKDEEDSNKERLRDIDKALKEQQRQIDIRLQEQTRTIINRYNDQLRVAQDAANKAIFLENDRYNKELAIKRQALGELLNIEAQGAAAAGSAHKSFWTYAVGLASSALSSLSATASSMTAAKAYTGKLPTSPGFGGGKPYLTPPQLATGGYIQREGLAYLHAGETVIPARGRGGGMTLNVNLNGATMKSVVAASKQEALKIVGIALDELGAT